MAHKMQNLKSIRVLIGDGGHQQTRNTIEKTFDTLVATPAQVAELSLEERTKITAISALFIAVSTDLIDLLPNLEIIASFGVGYDHIDAKYAAQKGIVVTHTPNVLDDEVADTTIGLLLNTLREFYSAEKYLRDGRWDKEGAYPLTQLSMRGRTVGIYGLGRIGQTIAKRLSGFDVPIHYHSRNQVEGVGFQYHSTLKGMAEAVDTLIAIVPGTPQTQHAINAEVLEALGKRGVLINVGRGPVVDEKALIAALQSKTIAAAGLDVFENEPAVPQALIDLPNACLFPHVASASEDTRLAMGNLVVDNLVQWFSEGSAITPTPETKQHKNRKT